MDLDVTRAFEERLNAHKVVTVPRGRLISDEGVAEPAQRPRPRSLSAPRTRQRATDLVQSLYDRMGVNLKRGQVSDLASSSPAVAENQSMGQIFLSRPTTPSNTHSIFQQRSPQEDSSANNFGEIAPSRSFHERYKAATSRGRASQRDDTAEESNTDRRPRSLSRGRVAQMWPPAARTSEESSPPVPVQQQPQQQQQPKSPYSPARAGSRPSWMESTVVSFNAGSSNNSPTRATEAEEKKEDQAPDAVITPISIKDRIGVFGTKKGSTPKAIRSRPTRNVDPHYAAQFAVRERPPKIDIYADVKEPATEVTDPSTVASPVASNDLEKSSKHQTQQLPLPESSQVSPLSKKPGSIAKAYMSALQSPAKSPKSACPDKPSVPPREIAVSSTPDLGLYPNDSHSLAGLSTVSGDEFSNTQNNKSASNVTGNSVKRQNWRTSPTKMPQNFNGGVSPAPPLPPPVVSTEEMIERMVEDRVRERMTDLEARLDNRLRQLVGAMEEKVMARLDAIERKISFS